MGAHHPEQPARLSAIAYQLISSGIGEHLQRYEAPLATDEQLARVHPLEYVRAIREVAPEEFKAWAALDGIVRRDGGAIPVKYRELIAIAVALATQCPYCLDAHTRGAKRAGATKAEVAEAAMLAAALLAGSAGTHSALAMKLFESA